MTCRNIPRESRWPHGNSSYRPLPKREPSHLIPCHISLSMHHPHALPSGPPLHMLLRESRKTLPKCSPSLSIIERDSINPTAVQRRGPDFTSHRTAGSQLCFASYPRDVVARASAELVRGNPCPAREDPIGHRRELYREGEL
ncbi:hypothetical protein BDP67DRAFT_514879 [Colletotrichum lupini]|nr:hypothetical protein BDP67DRAFT_514879 [Colletotrichum lupini]